MKNVNFLSYAVRLLAAIVTLVSVSFARTPEEIRKELIVKFRVPIIEIPDSIDSGGKELIKVRALQLRYSTFWIRQALAI